MKRNKNAFSGVNCIFLTVITIIWFTVFMPHDLMAQTDTIRTDSLNKVEQLKEVQIRNMKISRRQNSSTPLQILSHSAVFYGIKDHARSRYLKRNINKEGPYDRYRFTLKEITVKI